MELASFKLIYVSQDNLNIDEKYKYTQENIYKIYPMWQVGSNVIILYIFLYLITKSHIKNEDFGHRYKKPYKKDEVLHKVSTTFVRF